MQTSAVAPRDRLIVGLDLPSVEAAEAMIAQLGEEQAATLFPRYADAFPTAYREDFDARAAVADVRRIELQALPEGTTRILERAEADPPPRRLDEADIVVAVGAGADPAAIQEAAERAGAAIGGDRAACAAGRVPWGAEIGLQGRSVAPRVYLAIETTPGFEHLTGSVKAGVIAAIASDAGSPLLAAADVALVGDWRELAPALLTALS